MMNRCLILAAAFALAACATAPTYTPAAALGAPGYSETQVEANRFFVTYRASGSADAALLNDYALLRAADVTLQHNRDWFWVDRRSTDTHAGGYGGPNVGVSVGGGSFGRHSGVGVGVGMNFPLGGGHGPRASAATLEMRLGEGAKPDDPNAYDAHSLSASLRARLMTR